MYNRITAYNSKKNPVYHRKIRAPLSTILTMEEANSFLHSICELTTALLIKISSMTWICFLLSRPLFFQVSSMSINIPLRVSQVSGTQRRERLDLCSQGAEREMRQLKKEIQHKAVNVVPELKNTVPTKVWEY